MRIPLDTRTLIFGVFILGAIFAYVYFTFVQQSDRSVIIDIQLREVEERLPEAGQIYRDCASLSKSGTSAPSSVRSGCVESRGFVAWAREFSFDPKLNKVRENLLTLARTIEEMTDAIAIRPTSDFSRERLLQIPEQIDAVTREIENTKRWWKF